MAMRWPIFGGRQSAPPVPIAAHRSVRWDRSHGGSRPRGINWSTWSERQVGARSVASSFFPLDEELELLPGSLSPTLQEGVVRLGAVMPFGQVPSFVELWTKVRVSEPLVRRLTRKCGEALVAVEAAKVVEIERRCPPSPVNGHRLQVSVDGAMVPLIGGWWREVKTLVIGELRATDLGKATALSYFSRVQDFETFVGMATGELHRRGAFDASLVAAVADGAPWCQSFIDYHLHDAVRILDFPHAMEHLSKVSQAVFGPGSAAGSDWVGVQRHTLRHGDPHDVIAAVTALPVETASDPVMATQVRDQVQHYLVSRLNQIAYADFAAQGLPIGSGIVESANKLLVEARLKGAGMHWALGSVDPMLALRCALFSQRWSDAWQQLSRHRRVQAQRSQPRVRPVEPAPPPIARPEPLPNPTSHSPAKVKLVINGKPTKDHPWRTTSPV